MGVFCEIYLFTTMVTTYHSERGTDGCFVRFIYLLPWLLHITVREVRMGVFYEIDLLIFVPFMVARKEPKNSYSLKIVIKIELMHHNRHLTLCFI